MKLSLKEFCEELSISVATGKNWIKLGKISPTNVDGKPYFDSKYVSDFKVSLKNGKNSALKTRRNKKFVIGSSFYKYYVSEKSNNVAVVDFILRQEKEFSTALIECLLAECAIQQFLNCNDTNLLEKYLKNEIDLGNFNRLIDDIIFDKDLAKKIVKEYKNIFTLKYFSEPSEDVLGLLYLSCRKLSNRKSKGAYYTSTKVVRKLVDNLFNQEIDLAHKKILDSSCGTGNFLLNLPNGFKIENIYANDIDDMSVKITRLNLALKYNPENIETLYENITCADFLNEYTKSDFDYIIGNPPWGSEFNKKEIEFLRKKYDCVVGENVESFDVFVEEGLNRLKTKGKLAFVLPQAILNVKSHQPIREFIQHNSSIKYISYLGNVFDKVQCPSVILELEKTGKKMYCTGMRVDDGKREYVLESERVISADIGFNFLTDDNEQKILEKIINVPNKTTLKNNAKFALGIVTGNNSKYISDKKTDKNEIILKGSNIEKFRIKNVNSYIEFIPEKFQQVAPSDLYRVKEKLFYKFISKSLVFAYDDKQTLSLNSCNVVIPEIKGLSIKYVMSVLNSSVAQFLFEKQFNSMKVLRSHIEEIPIPLVSQNIQNKIINLVDKIIYGNDSSVYRELDKEVATIFGLNEKEYAIVKHYA